MLCFFWHLRVVFKHFSTNVRVRITSFNGKLQSPLFIRFRELGRQGKPECSGVGSSTWAAFVGWEGAEPLSLTRRVPHCFLMGTELGAVPIPLWKWGRKDTRGVPACPSLTFSPGVGNPSPGPSFWVEECWFGGSRADLGDAGGSFAALPIAQLCLRGAERSHACRHPPACGGDTGAASCQH